MDTKHCNNFFCKDRGNCWRYIGNYLVHEEMNISFLSKDCKERCEMFIARDEY